MRAGIAVLLFCLAIGASPVDARKIYKWVLPDGSVTYSDRPKQQGARELKLPPLQTYTPAPARASGSADQAAARDDSTVPYEVVQVVSPQPDQTIRDNNGTVSVRLELAPALQPGHVVEILLDGTAIGSGSATSASVTNVDRGSHTVAAVVKDASGKVVASAPGVAFHLKQASKLNPP
jgi:hypothetical protein